MFESAYRPSWKLQSDIVNIMESCLFGQDRGIRMQLELYANTSRFVLITFGTPMRADLVVELPEWMGTQGVGVCSPKDGVGYFVDQHLGL